MEVISSAETTDSSFKLSAVEDEHRVEIHEIMNDQMKSRILCRINFNSII